MQDEYAKFGFRLRLVLGLFILALLLSGITAFPLVWELDILQRWVGTGSAVGARLPGLAGWIDHVHAGLHQIEAGQPFMFYGTDWLAFGHIGIALAFWGVWRDPVRNRWLLQWGMLICILVIPLALICGPMRGIPFFWRVIDCQFGILGIIPLAICHRYARKMEALHA